MSVKGGYHILNLQNKDLQYSPTIPNAYESVEGSYQKPILISGINIGGVEKADVYRMPTVSGSSYVFENVYGYDLTLNDDDTLSISSTQWATREFASNINNIVDSDGNKRFIDGVITPQTIDADDVNYAKWTLSGSHLMVVLMVTPSANVTISGTTLGEIEFPEWIYNKIYPMPNSQHVMVNDATYGYASSNLAPSSASNRNYLSKQPSNIILIVGQSGDLEAGKTYRFQFDLIIE